MRAAVAAVEVSAGPEVGCLALFSIGPAFACVSGTVRRALLVGALAFVLCTAAACCDGMFGSRRATVALASVAGVTAAAALAAAGGEVAAGGDQHREPGRVAPLQPGQVQHQVAAPGRDRSRQPFAHHRDGGRTRRGLRPPRGHARRVDAPRGVSGGV